MSDETAAKAKTEVDRQLDRQAQQVAEQALRMVSINMPWLAPLIYAVQIVVNDRFPVAAVTKTGRVLVNPIVFTTIAIREATYVIAHELLHVALDTFSRETDFDDAETVNMAHDYIINDFLRSELHMDPPLGGLNWYGASEHSLEQVVAWMKTNGQPKTCWKYTPVHAPAAPRSPLEAALEAAGLVSPRVSSQPQIGRQSMDVIFPSQEAELFPNEAPSPDPVALQVAVEQSRVLLEVARQERVTGIGGHSGRLHLGLKELYANPPWESVMQRWLEAVAPSERTFARPSRRGADRGDCILPGRNRVGWTLHIVLDTSGSMVGDLPYLLGTIKSFCENAGVSEIHMIQCSDQVAADDWLPIEALSNVQVCGGAGSDMSPAFERMSQDPEVESMLIITDGFIQYPSKAPDYAVLWAVIGGGSFQPAYGSVVIIQNNLAQT